MVWWWWGGGMVIRFDLSPCEQAGVPPGNGRSQGKVGAVSRLFYFVGKRATAFTSCRSVISSGFFRRGGSDGGLARDEDQCAHGKCPAYSRHMASRPRCVHATSLIRPRSSISSIFSSGRTRSILFSLLREGGGGARAGGSRAWWVRPHEGAGFSVLGRGAVFPSARLLLRLFVHFVVMSRWAAQDRRRAGGTR